VIVGINVAEPYVPADTPDVARSIATAPDVVDCVILEIEFEVNVVTGVCDEIVVVLPYAST
jgi:ABC-type branched-subunit amino acid transport system ATPase component